MKLKRFAAAALVFCLILTLLPGGVLAAFGVGWSLDADGVLTVTKDVYGDDGEKWGAQVSDITQVLIGRDVTTVSGMAFEDCDRLESFEVEEGNTAFSAGTDGVLYSFEKDEIVCYPAAASGSYAGEDGRYMVPESVRMVCRGAFSGLIKSGNPVEIYAFKDTLTSVTANCKNWSGDDFPEEMIHPYVPVTGVRLDKETLPVEVGGTGTLNVTVLPEDATFQEVSWVSEAVKFAKVDGNGTVTGILAGTSKIVVTTADGEYTASCLVTVVKKDVDGLSLTPNPLELNKGETEILTAELTPYNATYKNISFLSTDTNVVTISGDENVREDSDTGAVTVEAKEGATAASASVKVTAVNPGTASIIATTADGGYYAVCAVTVPPTDITSFTLDHDTLELTRAASGENREAVGTLKATVEPADATYGKVSWYSSDTAVVVVEANESGSEAKLTTAGPGEAAVVARTEDGRQLSCAVKVWDTPTGAGVSLTKLTLAPGDEQELYAMILPATARQDVIWSSDKPEIAEVDPATGVVTAVANGDAAITATSKVNGGIKAECKVTVQTSVAGVTLNKNALTLAEDGREQLTATVAPDTATTKDVTWISYNEAVATVDAYGVVTAAGPGTTKILAVTADGGKTAECTVTVEATKVTGVTLDQSAVTLGLNGTATLTAAVAPGTAINKGVTWTSSDTSVVTVSNGQLTAAVKEGTATVTVTTAEGGFTAECTVTVQRNAVTRVTLDRNELTLAEGGSAQLTATVAPENADDRAVTWESSDPSVATVGSSGAVTAVKAGSAVITVTTSDGSFTATCTVTVLPTRVTGITLNAATLSLKEGDTAKLTATVAPAEATDKTVKWISTNEDAVIVTGDGDLRAIDPGTAVIIAATADGGFTAKCTVTVYQPVETISIHKAQVTLNAGETDTLVAIILPETASKDVTWSSDNTDVATVNEQTGVVTAKKGGTATITATSVADGKSATCEVTVREAVTDVRLNVTAYVLELGGSMDQLKELTLAATVEPENATNKKVRWFSSNTDIAEVDENGHVTPKAPGTAAIIAVTEDGGKFASCTVTVRNAVTGVTLDKTSLSLMKGTSAVLIATVNPSATADQSVTWESSDTSKVTVINGEVLAVAEGTATVTVKSRANPDRYAECVVTVTNTVVSVGSITLDRTALTLKKGENETLTATVTPAGADNQNVKWESTNEAVAAVSDGTVTAKAPGSATIIATTEDGGHMAWCTVTVQPVVESVTLNTTEMSIGLKDQRLRTLTATVAPYDAVDQNIEFTVSDNTVIKLAGAGSIRTVIPLQAGTAIVTVTAGGKTAACNVTVSNGEQNYAEISEKSLSLTMGGESRSLTVGVMNNGASIDITGFTTVWSSSNASAAVDQNGTVRPAGEGTALITATVTDKATGQIYTASCAVTVIPVPAVPVTGVTLDRSTLSLKKGDPSVALTATITPTNPTNPGLIWHSSNVTAATVDQSGAVTAVGAGTAAISVTTKDGGYTAECEVTVTSDEVTGLILNKTALSLVYNAEAPEKETLTATISGGTAPAVSWSSSDETVATVSGGEVTAAGKGTATITASVTQDGKTFTATCEVTVRTPVTGLTLSPKSVTLELGGADGAETTTLTATVTPGSASDTSVKWYSSNPAVAAVDENSGKVTAVNPGTAAIVAAAADGGYVDSCTVTVRKLINAITLNKGTLTLTVGEKETLVASVNEGADPGVTWSSSDATIASVDETTGVVTANAAGSAVITATSTTNSGIKGACTVTVNAETTPVTGVTLNRTELTLKAAEGDNEAQSETLTATVTPVGATNTTVAWQSTDTGVATVDNSGKVTAVAPGKATVIATTEDGRFTAMCAVTVPAPDVKVTLDETSLTMYVGDGNTTLTATVTPATAAYGGLNWFSSDDDIAKVSGTGMTGAVTPGTKSGTAAITATTSDGKYSATCIVTVWKKTTGLTLNKTSLTLAPDESWGLSATVSPSGANPAVKWSVQTEDSGCVTVTQDGLVTAHFAGEADIIATTEGRGEGVVICRVKVGEYRISGEIEAPTMSISDGSEGKIVKLSATEGDKIYYTLSTAGDTEPEEYDEDNPIEVKANTTVKAYAVRGNYQSAVVTGVVNVTEASNSMVLTDKMGNTIESLAEAADGTDLSFTASITLSAEATEKASDIYLAVYDTEGALISLEKFVIENTETGADSQVISQYLKLTKTAGTSIGSIKLMVLSEGKVPVISAGTLSG